MQHNIFTGSSLPPSCGLVKRTHEGPRQSQNAGLPARSRANTAVSSTASPALCPEQSPVILSAHPDAVRRRREAEQRRDETREQTEIARQPSWYEGPAPSNFLHVNSQEAFTEAIAAEKLVVVDFFVPWCVACRRFHPALIKLAAKHPDCTFLAVNGGDPSLHEFVASLGVDRLPYFQVFHAGRLLRQFAANLSKIQFLRSQIALCKEQILAGATEMKRQGDKLCQGGQELASLGIVAARQASEELLGS